MKSGISANCDRSSTSWIWIGRRHPCRSPWKAIRANRSNVRVVGAELLNPVQMAEYQRTQALLRLLVDPLDAQAHLELGIELTLDGQQAEGQAEVALALALRPDLPEANTHRACLNHPTDRRAIRRTTAVAGSRLLFRAPRAARERQLVYISADRGSIADMRR